MSEQLVSDITNADESQIRLLIDDYFAAMRRLNERIARDQEEIKQLQAETRSVIDRLPAGGFNVEAILRTGATGLFAD